MKKFNVIWYNPNSSKIEPYDVIGYFMYKYENTRKKDRPITEEGFKKFIVANALNMY